MVRRILRRLGGAALVLLAVSFITFATLATIPGDAAQGMAGDSASAEQVEELRVAMGLHLPLLTRYTAFLENLALRGDMGRSLVSGRPVSQLIADRLPYTVLLALSATLLAALAGVVIGTLAALRAGTLSDTALMAAAGLGMAVPSFWLGLLLIMLFSLRLGWLPVVGAESPRHLILPAVTLALPTAAVIARLMRSGLVETLRSDYVTAAHAKGLTPRRVLTRHVFRNSVLPVVTLLGLYLGHLLGGAFIVESLFGWPGLGRLTVQAIFDRDYPVVLGAALAVAALYLVVNFVVDMAHAWLDPRVGEEAV
jgi:ABC-type dipeptide/oligopeptide/nickel transport system permease component